MPETSSRKMNKLRYPMITAMNLTYQCQPCTTMEIFHDISCSTHWTCQPSNTMGCHANAGMTAPCYCNLYVHAREPHTFQDVSGPRSDHYECQKNFSNSISAWLTNRQASTRQEGGGRRGSVCRDCIFWLLLPISLAQVCHCLSWACIDWIFFIFTEPLLRF